MDILQALVLGLIQGISEFLPISSSGHLILVPRIFGWQDQGIVFDVAVHLATLGAVFYVFSDDVKKMVRGFIGRGERQDATLAWMIAIATVPAVLVGLFFGDAIEVSFRDPKVVATNLAFWGVVLAVADFVGQRRRKSRQSVNHPAGPNAHVNWKQAITAGVAQAIALIPGTSRSGITISAGLFTGLDRVQAARFSFLLGIPAIAGAGVLTFVRASAAQTPVEWLPTIIGFLAALVAGIVSIRWLLKIISRISYSWFAVYRVLIALLIFALM